MTVRAKFRCTSVEQFENHANADQDGMKKYKFTAVTDDGTPENKRYHKYSPSGEFEIQVDNPEVEFRPGYEYYLDIIEAPKA